MGILIVSIGKEESGVKSGREGGAAVGAEKLSPLLCSVMGNAELKVSKGRPA